MTEQQLIDMIRAHATIGECMSMISITADDYRSLAQARRVLADMIVCHEPAPAPLGFREWVRQGCPRRRGAP